MDRTHPCGGCNVGSIPAGSTKTNKDDAQHRPTVCGSTKNQPREDSHGAGFVCGCLNTLRAGAQALGNARLHAGGGILFDNASLGGLVYRLVKLRQKCRCLFCTLGGNRTFHLFEG